MVATHFKSVMVSATAAMFGVAMMSGAITETNDLYTGDLVLNDMHGFLLEEGSAEILAALERLRVLFPSGQTAHPGHGDPGDFLPMLEPMESYTQIARALAAAELPKGQDVKGATASVEKALLEHYPEYGVPGGQPNMVGLSAAGVVTELKVERSSLPQVPQ